jgi:voltage-gated potassium channel
VENVANAREAEDQRSSASDSRMQDQLRSVSLQIDTLTRQLTHGSHQDRPAGTEERE